MKLDILLMSEEGVEIAKALESNVTSLIINGVEVIRNGDIQTEMRQLARGQQHDIQPRHLLD